MAKPKPKAEASATTGAPDADGASGAVAEGAAVDATALAARIAELEADNAALSDRVAELQSERDALRSQMAGAESDTVVLNERVLELVAELQNARGASAVAMLPDVTQDADGRQRYEVISPLRTKGGLVEVGGDVWLTEAEAKDLLPHTIKLA